MHPIRRILVAVKDPQSKSLPAVAKAAQLAEALGASLELFHGISSPLLLDAYALSREFPRIERETRNECIAQLERIAAGLRTGGIEVSTSAEWEYPVYEAIIRRALHSHADLLVAERHVGRHIVPGLLHLTDWELLRLSSLPVLLVKTGGTYRRPAILAAIDPAHTFSKPAKLDAEILKTASTLATALRGRMHALHAYIAVPAVPSSRATPSSIQAIAARAAVEAAERFEQALAKSGIPHKNRHLIARHPIDAIQEVARENACDIVVMGAISRSGFKRLIIGNTAEGVLDALTCDLLIVKPRTFVANVRAAPRGLRYATSALVQGPF
jgi:universal stress protein E